MELNLQKMLIEFHEKYGHCISDEPTLDIPEEVKSLRYRLITEETNETLNAMGFFDQVLTNIPSKFDPHAQDLVETADGIADAMYVLVGTAVSYGIPIMRIFQEVHRSNMTKTAARVEPGQKYGTKTPKGPDYVPPDIAGILYHPREFTQLEIKHGDHLKQVFLEADV